MERGLNRDSTIDESNVWYKGREEFSFTDSITNGLRYHCVVSTEKHGEESIFIYGCFSFERTESIAGAEGTLEKGEYKRALEFNMTLFDEV